METTTERCNSHLYDGSNSGGEPDALADNDECDTCNLVAVRPRKRAESVAETRLSIQCHAGSAFSAGSTAEATPAA
jgi:hypothetical protein